MNANCGVPPATRSLKGVAPWLAGRAGKALPTLSLLILAGCVPWKGSEPKAEVAMIQRKPEGTGFITPTALQAETMRFADAYSQVVEQAADDFAARVGTAEARVAASQIKINQTTAAIVSAAGQNPVVNALDLFVLTSVSRMVAEDYFVGERFGDAAIPLLETSRRMESNAWSLVAQVLRPEQQQEVQDLIFEWRVKNPQQRYVASVRFREFAESIGKAPKSGAYKPTSVFSLLFLDPMAGLDPTVRAVEEARYLAERVLYYGQRMPSLLGWQAEFLTLRLADQPAPKQVLTNLNQVAASLEVFSQTAEQLPQLINDQREAAIRQIFEGVAAERTNILASLNVEEAKVRGVLSESRQTLVEFRAAATALDEAIRSLDAFIHYVKPPRTNQVVRTNATPRRPFDVLDYGTAASHVGDAAQDLTTLLTSVNQSTPEVARLGRQTAGDLQKVVQRAFWLGLVLIVVLLAGAVLAGLSYRILVNHWARRGRGTAAPPSSHA